MAYLVLFIKIPSFWVLYRGEDFRNIQINSLKNPLLKGGVSAPVRGEKFLAATGQIACLTRSFSTETLVYLPAQGFTLTSPK